MSAQKQTSARGDTTEVAASDGGEKRVRQPKSKSTEVARTNSFVVIGQRLRGTYQDTLSEMKKINWPDQETTRNLTIVVIGISVVMGALLGTIDYVLVKLLGLF